MTGQKTLLAAAIVGIMVLGGCGKSSDPAWMDGAIPVSGSAGFGMQCPQGTVSPVLPNPLGLFDCATDLSELELAESPEPIMVQADCLGKQIKFRNASRSINSGWLTLPDGSFDVTLDDAGTLHLKSDGAGHDDCVTHVALRLSGQMFCNDQSTVVSDNVPIKLTASWLLGRGKNHPALPGQPQEVACKLPASCHMDSQITLKQCQ